MGFGQSPGNKTLRFQWQQFGSLVSEAQQQWSAYSLFSKYMREVSLGDLAIAVDMGISLLVIFKALRLLS